MWLIPLYCAQNLSTHLRTTFKSWKSYANRDLAQLLSRRGPKLESRLDVVWVPEAYSFDAPSAMGYLAAQTERVTIASGILPIYTRTQACWP